MELIYIAVPDGPAEAYVARPSAGSGPGVLFFVDVIGIRPQIVAMADRIASWGHVVLAPNVFCRDGTVDEVSPLADLREPGARDAFFGEPMPRVGGLTSDRAMPDIAAYVDALQSLDGVTDSPIGTTGYCMGARLAVRAGTGHPDLDAAVYGFHGGGLVNPETDSPQLAIGNATAEFVFGHADNDGSMPPEAVATIGDALESHGLSGTNVVYEGAPHGYSMADTSRYQEAAAERHFTELEALPEQAL